MITLQACAYEHIVIAHPSGLLVPRFMIHVVYATNIMHWRYDFYIHPIDGVHQDIDFYRVTLSYLILDNINFRPYHL